MTQVQESVSVLVPAYQAAGTIGEALESALAQVPAPLEIIVSDDGSTDDLHAVLRSFGERIRVVHGANAGLATARNRAAAVAHGTFLGLLDADDVWLPGRIRGVLDLATRRPELDIITTDAHVVRNGVRDARTYYEERGWPDGDQVDAILRNNFIFGAGAIRRSAFERVGGYRAGRRFAEDWDLWLRLLLSGSRAGLVAEPLYEYRRREGSLTRQQVDLALGVLAALEDVESDRLTAAQRRILAQTRAEWRLRAAAVAAANRDRRRWVLGARAAMAPGAPARERARAAGRPIVSSLRSAAEVLDPSRVALGRATVDGAVALACVYRARNERVVADLIDGAPEGASVALWSLDGDIPAALAAHTVGSGPGSRFELLNRLVTSVPPSARDGALVLCDDDVELVVGDVAALVGLGRALGLDLFQPSHSRTSFASESTVALVRTRPLTVGRVTGLVEQGPLVVLSAAAQAALLPLPEDMGMGWGIEARWARTAREAGLVQGIVDAVVIRHLAPPASSYDTTGELARLDAELRAGGWTSFQELQTVDRTIGLRDGITAARRRTR